MSKPQKVNTNRQLFREIRDLIEESRQVAATTINTTLVLLYWNVGKKINEAVLGNKRAEYGKQIVASLAQQLTQAYGRGWDEKMLRHCLRSAETFSNEMILYAVSRQLGWTHLRTLMYLKDEMQRQFYLEMCIQERWSTRMLAEKINGMMYCTRLLKFLKEHWRRKKMMNKKAITDNLSKLEVNG